MALTASEIGKLSLKARMELRAKKVNEAKLYHADNEQTWTGHNQDVIDEKIADVKLLADSIKRDNVLADIGGDDPMHGIRNLGSNRFKNGIVAVKPGQKFSEACGYSSHSGVEHGFGETIRAVVLGSSHDKVLPEIRSAMGTGDNSQGGVLVDPQYFAEVIDLMQPKTALIKAGMRVVPMKSNEGSFAKVLSHPTIQVKAENDLFVESTISLGSVRITVRTFGTIITASREQAEDDLNFAELIESEFLSSLASQVDYFGIQGTASAQPTGLTIHPSITETGSIGPIQWEDYIAAATAVRVANHEPGAIILSPTIHSDAFALTTGDGTNSAKGWLPAPPHLDNVKMLPTANCPDAFSIIGNFSKMFFGLRQNALIERTTEGGEAFERHQLKLKVTSRGGYAIADGTAFHRLAGITT